MLDLAVVVAPLDQQPEAEEGCSTADGDDPALASEDPRPAAGNASMVDGSWMADDRMLPMVEAGHKPRLHTARSAASRR
jgi:hypothetical protein